METNRIEMTRTILDNCGESDWDIEDLMSQALECMDDANLEKFFNTHHNYDIAE